MLVARRVRVMPLLVLTLVQVGCAPARHSVRLQTLDGQVRVTTPAPRPPLVLPKEEVRRAVRALAQKVVPVADPVEFARERFEVPIREGVYIFNARTKELKPADRATEAAEEPSPEALAQARGYLRWCEDHHQPFDCFGALHGRRTLDAYGRYTVTMGIAIANTFEATGESLKDMVSVQEVLGMVVAGVTMYAVLWVIPEPTSKAIAAAMTIVLVGWVGVHTLYTLGAGWSDLIDRADAATTFDALKDAGEDYAKVMGADNARILVMVATAAVGSGLSQFLKALPSLPGAGPASGLAVAEGGVPFGQVGAVEAVTIGKGGLTISLTTGAVLASSLSGNFGSGPRINLIRPTPDPEAEAVAERIRALKKAGVRGNLDQLKKRIAEADNDGPLGELEAAERWLRQGVKGEDIEVLEASRVQGRTSPDFRVKGELTEIKTRVQPLNHRSVSDAVGSASRQIRESGLDAGRPMVGTGGRGPQGQVEIQLNGEAARTGTLDVIEAQVRESFNLQRGDGLRRVAVFCNGRLVGEWVRTAANVIVRTFPL
jgi:hypothetical protein